jgi:hypothetical protein
MGDIRDKALTDGVDLSEATNNEIQGDFVGAMHRDQITIDERCVLRLLVNATHTCIA